jgi:RNA polymerase sigma factor (TIGR02999 family)
MSDVTVVLDAIRSGDPEAPAQLLPLVYEELRRLAAHRLAREAPGQTLQPTDLVHEAYLRLVGTGRDQHWGDRGHFFAAAATAPRRILVENARRKRRLKRGGGRARRPLEEAELLATCGEDGTARLWGLTAGEPRVRTIGPGPFGGVRAAEFTPDGRYLATANANGTVYLLRVGAPP